MMPPTMLEPVDAEASAYTMSAESAMLLNRVDELEWAISGVSFDHTVWDRRRALAKLASLSLRKPLPHVWRAARKPLDAPSFKALLSKHLAPERLAPKEYGALLELFGSDRVVDSSDFAVFYKELG